MDHHEGNRETAEWKEFGKGLTDIRRSRLRIQSIQKSHSNLITSNLLSDYCFLITILKYVIHNWPAISLTEIEQLRAKMYLISHFYLTGNELMIKTKSPHKSRQDCYTN